MRFPQLYIFISNGLTVVNFMGKNACSGYLQQFDQAHGHTYSLVNIVEDKLGVGVGTDYTRVLV